MRAALLSVRAMRALSVLSRSSARVPSRLVSTEAAAEGSIGSTSASRGDRLVKEMTPIATFLGIVVTIGAVGAYYSSRLSALEERMIGVVKEVDAKIAGSEKAVEAKIAGSEKAVEAKIARSEKAVDAKIAGFKEAADLKVRFLMLARARTIDLHSHAPPPPHLQYKTK